MPAGGDAMPYISRDDVRLYCEEDGSPLTIRDSKGPALVFVHGWCCDHTHFSRQVDHFRARHPVVSLDLRGHGQSDKPPGDYTMPLFADDVAFVCRELGIERAVAVGHSMGGSVVAAMAARHPGLVRAAVAIDSPLITTEAARQRLAPRIEALAGADYLATAHQVVDSMFLPCDDPERRRRITEGMTGVPQHTMLSAMSQILVQTPESLGTISQPFLLISAGWVPFDMAAVREVVPNLSYAQTYGSGHFSMLEVPEQVNAMIERFLALETNEH
jgi:pimeloyl-ACP methyl ester carboxylesterase